MQPGQSTVPQMPSTGVQGMINKKFFGKKSLRPKGKPMAKAMMAKTQATKMMQ